MLLYKSLPQGLFRWEDANSNKLISRCYHAAGLGLRDTVKCPPGCWKAKQSKNNSDREHASNWEHTEVKWRFSELRGLSDGSQICLKTSEITSRKPHNLKWPYMQLDLLVKATIKTSLLNLQTKKQTKIVWDGSIACCFCLACSARLCPLVGNTRSVQKKGFASLMFGYISMCHWMWD